MSDKSQRIFVTGHRGLLGRAVVDELKRQGYNDVITADRGELDLTDSSATLNFLKAKRPSYIIHCAALVGGIQANSARPVEFYRENALMQLSVIDGAHAADVNNLMFFGSNCMYPLGLPQPMDEGQILKGPIEPSNLAYGTAKISGYVQCLNYHKQFGRNYFTVIPASLYGPFDNYDVNQCHVTPALLLRMHFAKKNSAESFVVWGTGKPRRELLYVGDAANGVVLLLGKWKAEFGTVNLGAGKDISVQEIAETIKDVVGFRGRLENDLSKPDGNPQKLLDSRKIFELGFRPQVILKDGLAKTYQWLLNAKDIRGVRPGDL